MLHRCVGCGGELSCRAIDRGPADRATASSGTGHGRATPAHLASPELGCDPRVPAGEMNRSTPVAALNRATVWLTIAWRMQRCGSWGIGAAAPARASGWGTALTTRYGMDIVRAAPAQVRCVACAHLSLFDHSGVPAIRVAVGDRIGLLRIQHEGARCRPRGGAERGRRCDRNG